MRRGLLGRTSVHACGGTLLVEDKIALTSRAGERDIVLESVRACITLTGFGSSGRPSSNFSRLTAVHITEGRVIASDVSLLLPS